MLESYGVEEVCMESSRVYWMPVWRVLEPKLALKLASPYFIRQLPGRKSDVKDAEWMATCLLKGLVRGSYVPAETVQQLRQCDRRISDLNKEMVRKFDKPDAALQRCNIRLGNYVSNVDGKSYREVAGCSPRASQTPRGWSGASTAGRSTSGGARPRLRKQASAPYGLGNQVGTRCSKRKIICLLLPPPVHGLYPPCLCPRSSA